MKNFAGAKTPTTCRKPACSPGRTGSIITTSMQTVEKLKNLFQKTRSFIWSQPTTFFKFATSWRSTLLRNSLERIERISNGFYRDIYFNSEKLLRIPTDISGSRIFRVILQKHWFWGLQRCFFDRDLIDLISDTASSSKALTIFWPFK